MYDRKIYHIKKNGFKKQCNRIMKIFLCSQNLESEGLA